MPPGFFMKAATAPVEFLAYNKARRMSLSDALDCGDQSQDSQSPWNSHPALAARPRRRGDRMRRRELITVLAAHPRHPRDGVNPKT